VTFSNNSVGNFILVLFIFLTKGKYNLEVLISCLDTLINIMFADHEIKSLFLYLVFKHWVSVYLFMSNMAVSKC